MTHEMKERIEKLRKAVGHGSDNWLCGGRLCLWCEIVPILDALEAAEAKIKILEINDND